MATVRHLELIFGNSGPTTKSSCRTKAAFQISVGRISSFEDIVIQRFSKFGKLKCLFTAEKCRFWGSFDPYTLSFIVETPKGTSLRETASEEPSCVKTGSVVFAVGDDKKKRKERKGKVQKITKSLYFT